MKLIDFNKNTKQDLKRSSLAIAEYWGIQPEVRLQNLCDGIQAPFDPNSQVKFEHEVESAQSIGTGENRASCTDVVIDNPLAPIAIEGKRTEPSYETVEKWLGNQTEPAADAPGPFHSVSS